MTIRKAEARDKGRVLAMARAFHAASGVAVPFSAALASMVFDATLADPDRLCLVLEVGGVATGVLAAQAGPHGFFPVKLASELMFWIDPPHRGTTAARHMIAAFEMWARSRDCQISHLVGLGDEPAVGRLYARCGYQPAERHFMKHLL
ncbi:GNAT family N-acetyltransferase [Shinella sp. BYT-45]|uniref:GNAT family N-acetyltransferase n=1 Tax=Shinella sp. BYT-45 TaxID=3377377 RepID=UPI0039811030